MAIPKQQYEVFVNDPFTGTKIVAEYRGELVRKEDGWPVYKVYSNFFDNSSKPTVESQMNAFRWVKKIQVLGLPPSQEEVRAHLSNNSIPDGFLP